MLGGFSTAFDGVKFSLLLELDTLLPIFKPVGFNLGIPPANSPPRPFGILGPASDVLLRVVPPDGETLLLLGVPEGFPFTRGELRSFVTVFLSLFPFCMSCKSKLRPFSPPAAAEEEEAALAPKLSDGAAGGGGGPGGGGGGGGMIMGVYKFSILNPVCMVLESLIKRNN